MVANRFRALSALAAVLFLIAGCSSKTTQTAMEQAPSANATAQANEAGSRTFMAGMARGDTTVVDSFIAVNFVEHQQMPGMPPGAAGLKAFIAAWHTAFPDLQLTINDMAADSDKVWIYSTMSGTMKGPLMGMKPTGKSFHADSFDLVRIENGKVVEHWGMSDNMGMMQQLGLSMAPPGGKKGAK
jgi:predicted ester cyclase